MITTKQIIDAYKAQDLGMINTDKLIKAYKAQSWDLENCKCDTKTTKPTGLIITALVRLGEYQKKDTPMPVLDYDHYWRSCPKCRMRLDEIWNKTYCSNCGQRLDWGKSK